jgi:hypothetical protein
MRARLGSILVSTEVGIRDLVQAAVDTSNSQVVDADAKRRVLQMPQGVFRDLIEVSHQRSSHSMFPLSFWRVASLVQSCRRGLTWGPWLGYDMPERTHRVGRCHGSADCSRTQRVCLCTSRKVCCCCPRTWREGCCFGEHFTVCKLQSNSNNKLRQHQYSSYKRR